MYIFSVRGTKRLISFSKSGTQHRHKRPEVPNLALRDHLTNEIGLQSTLYCIRKEVMNE